MRKTYYFVRIQAIFRKRECVRELLRWNPAARRIQAWVRGHQFRWRFKLLTALVIALQRHARRRAAIGRLRQQSAATVFCQKLVRSTQEQKSLMRDKEIQAT